MVVADLCSLLQQKSEALEALQAGAVMPLCHGGRCRFWQLEHSREQAQPADVSDSSSWVLTCNRRQDIVI